MKDNTAKPDASMETESDTPASRSKTIGAKLKQQRRIRDGVAQWEAGNRGSILKQQRRLPDEETEARNQRILTRYLELVALANGKTRGVQTQLEKEFELRRQYIERAVIRPYLERTKELSRK
jgi:hypothetical protein